MGTVSKRLRFGNRWEVMDSVGRKGGLYVAWSDQVKAKVMRKRDFYMEVQIVANDDQEIFWVFCVHASTEAKTRQRQQKELINRRQFWGDTWIIRGAFNDIKDHVEKKSGRKRLESSFLDFKNFITNMKTREVKFRGESYTWANNREGEGFIQEMLDKFFGSTRWLLHFDKGSVQHIMRQTSDHAMFLLDTQLWGIKKSPNLFLRLDGQRCKRLRC